jgi:hypothetical protein
MIFIGLAVKMCTKTELPLQLREAAFTPESNFPPLPSVEATGICIPIGHTGMFLAAVYKSPQRLCSDKDITELLDFRNKSILACDLNSKHPVWNSKFSNPSGLMSLELFLSCNF